MKQLLFSFIILFLIGSCKSNNKTKPSQLISKKQDLVNLDSLNLFFKNLYKYQKNYTFQSNLKKNYPKIRKRIEKMDSSKYYSGLIRLLDLYSKADKYKDRETDSINRAIINRLIDKQQLNEIRNLYKSDIIIDSLLTEKDNIKTLITKYNKISFYIEKYPYFRDSLNNKIWEICPIYYKLLTDAYSKEETTNKAFEQKLLQTNTEYLENKNFVHSLIIGQQDSITPSYLKNIAPIFDKINDKNCIYGTSPDYYADNNLFKKSYIPQKIVDNNYMLFNFQEDSLVISQTNTQQIYAYTSKERKEVKVQSFGYQPDECIDAYYVFPLKKNHKDEFLFSSTYKLDIEFDNFPQIDNILQENYSGICNDCPHGWSHLKTFGNLKGYKNLYFAATKIEKTDDTDTFIRAVFTINDKQQPICLWYGEFDNFGCACL